MTKLERLLKLLAALLDTSVPLTAEDLRQRIGGYSSNDDSFRRAFERDKDDLRQCGINIVLRDSVDGDQPNGYIIDPDEYAGRDPGLDADELAALHLAAALVRVESMDDDALWKLGGRPIDNASTDAAGVAVDDAAATDIAGTLHEAIVERRRASFDYDNRGQREVEPARLTFKTGHWYVTAFDPSRDGVRSFRLDRITSEVAVGEPGVFAARNLPGPQVTRTWELGDEEPTEATVQIAQALASSARVHLYESEIDEQPDGSIVATVTVRNSDMFRDWVLEFYDNAVVLAPDSMRNMMISWIEQTVAS